MSGLTPSLVEFLKLCGIRKSRIDDCDLDTELYHDLRVYGEIAEGCIEVLIKVYQVDMTHFNFEAYFPNEYTGRTGLSRFIFCQIPFAQSFVESKANCRPLTLRMIEDIMHSKRWPPAFMQG